jgi:diguanylate cyclase
MRLSWIRQRAAARTAIGALAVGLTLLAGLAVVNTQNTAKGTERIAATEQVSQQWGEVSFKLGIEYEQLIDYLRAETDIGRQPLISSIGSAEPHLRWLSANGGPHDAFQAQSLQNAYGGYSYTLRHLIAADQRGDEVQVQRDAEQAALSASALRKQAAVNIARTRLEIGVIIRQTQDTSRQLQSAVEVMSGVDLVLVLFCALVLLAYQRNTERQAAENRYRASHDGLTGVANRNLLAERIDGVIDTVRRTGGGAGLLLLDLNRFKEVNDTLGHHYGDLLLQEVARRLTGAARQGDLVARLGGDEFAVLLPDVASPADLMAIGDRFRAAVCGAAELNGLSVDVSASIGAAGHPYHGTTAAELLQHADIAMYSAKRGHLGLALYRPEADEHTVERLSVLGELRHGIEHGELELHYQPKLAAGSRDLCGVEALVRWRHPTRGLLGPDQFVSVAEQSDLMPALTDAVLATALTQHRSWRRDGLLLPVAVNVGTACLLDTAFPSRVEAMLREYAVPTGQLTIEITESAMITDPARACSVLTALRDLGIRLSIDDFGTGYSAMSYLQSMPLDELKIDRQFTARIMAAPSGRAIVTSMVDLAHALSLDVVAEGVEDEETCALLERMGCEAVQGYHISRPLPAAEIRAWIERPGRSFVSTAAVYVS